MAVAPFPAMLCRPLQMAARATVCAMRAAEPDQEDMMSGCRDPMADMMSSGMPPPYHEQGFGGVEKGRCGGGLPGTSKAAGGHACNTFPQSFPTVGHQGRGQGVDGWGAD